MSPHIETIVTLFAKKERRERLLFLASRADRWDQFRHDLLHDTRALDERALTPLPSAKPGPEPAGGTVPPGPTASTPPPYGAPTPTVG